MNLNEEAIQKAVVDRAVEQLLDDYNWRSEALKAIRERVGIQVDTIIDETVTKAIEDKVNQLTREGFEHTYTKAIDGLGRKSETTTINAELEKLMQGYWQQRVNKNTGKPTSDSFNSITRAEYVMIQVCGEDFFKNMKQEVTNNLGAMKDGLRDQLRIYTEKMLDDLFKVRSLGDKRKNKQ